MGFFSKKKKEEAQSPPSENKVNLMKERVDLVKKISLEKNIPVEQKSRVALVLDYSGSMDSLYKTGFVQELLERLMPIGIRFDDNQAIDVFLFHNQAYEIGEVTSEEFEGFVQREITSKYRMGGTEYSPVIEMVLNKYKSEKGDPAYVMFITDGDCSDKASSTNSIIEAAKSGIFWQFIGIGNAGFAFLEKLDNMEGRVVDNANFFQVGDLTRISDEELYNKMMDEYPEYLVKAKSLSII